MQAVKHELGGLLPAGPMRRGGMGRFPTTRPAPAHAHIAACGQRGRSSECGGCRGMLAAPPGKALGVPKSGSGQGRGSCGLCFPRTQLQLGGGRHTGGVEQGCFGTSCLRFCKAGSGRVSGLQGCRWLGLSQLHMAQGSWKSCTWFERLRGREGSQHAACARRLDGFAACAACQRAALLSHALPSCS